MMALAEDVLLETGALDWNSRQAKERMAAWLRRNGFNAESSVCEAADAWRRREATETTGRGCSNAQ